MFVYISTGVMMYKERFRIPIKKISPLINFFTALPRAVGKLIFCGCISCIPLFIEKAVHTRGKKGKSFVEL